MRDSTQHGAHTPAKADAYVALDLPAEIHRLHTDAPSHPGRRARTLIKYEDFRVVLIALVAEAHLPAHQAERPVSIHALSGHIQVTACGQTFSLRPGGLVALDHSVSHDVRALEDSTFLLTMAGPAPSRKATATIEG